MPLNIYIENDTCVALDIIEYDVSTSSFSLGAKTNEEIVFQIPYILQMDSSHPDEEFEIYLLYKKDIAENDIYHVYENKIGLRLGWIFPLQALLSKEHSFSNNEHFLPFASASFSLLCKNKYDSYIKQPKYNPGTQYNLLDFYSEDTVVMCLWTKGFPASYTFDIYRYIPCCFKYGYYLQTKRNPGDIQISEDAKLSDRFNLVPMSDDLDKDKYIQTLLLELLPYESNVLIGFFHIYQVVELLMENIFVNEHKKAAAKLLAEQTNPYVIKDIIEEIQSSLSERNRLKRLLSHYLTTKIVDGSLKATCNVFLAKNSAKEGNFFYDYFYNVRNRVFHSYRDLSAGSADDFDNIVKLSRPVMSDLLINFKCV